MDGAGGTRTEAGPAHAVNERRPRHTSRFMMNPPSVPPHRPSGGCRAESLHHQAALEPFARFGRPHHPSVCPSQKPSQSSLNRNLVATFDQIRSRGTVQRGPRIELPIGMPLTVFVGNLQSEGMVCFTKPGPHRSNGRVGPQGPLAFWEFGAIEAADAQLTRVQSQSLGNDRGGTEGRG